MTKVVNRAYNNCIVAIMAVVEILIFPISKLNREKKIVLRKNKDFFKNGRLMLRSGKI